MHMNMKQRVNVYEFINAGNVTVSAFGSSREAQEKEVCLVITVPSTQHKSPSLSLSAYFCKLKNSTNSSGICNCDNGNE